MGEVTTYTARAHREGTWWAVDIPELDLATQARRIDQIKYMARDLIATWLEIPADSFDVMVDPVLDPDVSHAAGAVRKATKEAAEAVEAAAVATRAFAADLLRKGYTVRDAGHILGVSPQRISQLTSTTATKPAKVSRTTAAGSKSTAGSALARSATKSTAAKANPRGTKTTTPAQSRMVMTRFKDGKTKGTR
jgi:predicted transcriptional regulator